MNNLAMNNLAMNNLAMNRLGCRSLTLSIGGVSIVREFDFTLEPGSFWGLLGANGSGKTTLLKCLAGLRTPDVGQVELDGIRIDELPRRVLARHVGMLQQHTAYAFDSSVLQTALTGRHPHLGYWQREGREDIGKAIAALDAADLSGLTERSVTELSGGEARRLAFATLLVQEPRIMLLDEPTNHLDLRHQVWIMGMIRTLSIQSEGSAIAALHDVNLAARYCSHVLMLYGNGEWVAGTIAELLNETSLQRLYGCAVRKLQSPEGPCFYPLTH
jgi:iron complex transport system ATP-binding protein